jgi:hypothetical protein
MAQGAGGASPVRRHASTQGLACNPGSPKDGDALFDHYRHTLEALGKQPGTLALIFGKAQNKFQDPAKLRRVIVDLIDAENWSALGADVKGDAYEGLLECHLLAGIDHGFSLPISYFARYGLKSWPEFLTDFVTHWATHLDDVYVDFVRDGSVHRHGKAPAPGQRVGGTDEFRLTEPWTSSAKSVFQLDVTGHGGQVYARGHPVAETAA